MGARKKRDLAADTVTTVAAAEVDETSLRIEAEQNAEALAIVEAFAITTAEDFETATDLLKECKARYKVLEAKRKHLKEPSLEAGRRIDEFFRPVLEPLLAAETRLKHAIGEYTRASQLAQHAAMTAYAGGAEALPPPSPKAEGVAVKTVWRVEVIDADAVPREYCSPDLAKLQKAIWYADTTTAPRPIPGVRFVADAKVTVRA